MSGADLGGSDLDWSGGAPRSTRFDDIYFSPQDGLAEARAVFLEGCGLPDAWAGRPRFTVAELGFGTGLNILAQIELWSRTRPTSTARLHVFSVEAHPLSRADAERALAAWPELARFAAPLLVQWPRGRRGFHRITLPDLGVIIDLALMDVAPALDAWTGTADAVLLDGFAPARNPDMWREDVLAAVAQRMAPGARAATFTVAGFVRRGLEAAGLTLHRRPGFGRKRERLEAHKPGEAPPPSPAPRTVAPYTVAVIGGGIAGASLVRALRDLGAEPFMVEAHGLGAGASGNAAALVSPRLDAGLGPVAELHAQAFARAVDLYTAEVPAAVLARGALQAARTPRDAARFAAVAAWDGFAPGTVRLMDDGLSLFFDEALVVEPAGVLTAFTGDTPLIDAQVARLKPAPGGWRLLAEDGALIAQADAVCLAGGAEVLDLLPGADLMLRPLRGQVDMAGGVTLQGPAQAWGPYAIPTRDGVLFGASHVRGDRSREPRAEESAANHLALSARLPDLAAQVAAAPTADKSARAGVRAATRDHTPVAGPAPGEGVEGLWLLGGLGGRGFSLAPLLAEHVAALICGAPSPLPAAAQALVDPHRSAARLVRA